MNRCFYLKFHRQKIYVHLAFPDDYQKHAAILFIHGAASNLFSSNLLIKKLKNKFVCLAFDHLGCGKSDGKFVDYSLQSRFEQARFMLDYLIKLKSVNKNKVIVVGSSMGAHVAARLTKIKLIKYLILRAPASYYKAYENIKMLPDWLPRNRQDASWPWQPSYALDAIGDFKGYLLVVKSEKDEIIPDKILIAYLQKAKKIREKQLVVIKNAPHRISDKPIYNTKFLKIIERFIFSH